MAFVALTFLLCNKTIRAQTVQFPPLELNQNQPASKRPSPLIDNTQDLTMVRMGATLFAIPSKLVTFYSPEAPGSATLSVTDQTLIPDRSGAKTSITIGLIQQKEKPILRSKQEVIEDLKRKGQRGEYKSGPFGLEELTSSNGRKDSAKYYYGTVDGEDVWPWCAGSLCEMNFYYGDIWIHFLFFRENLSDWKGYYKGTLHKLDEWKDSR